MEPYKSVRVNFDNDDYENVCERFGGGFDALPAWRDLGNLLAHRAGWHFNVANHGEALWCCGVLGEARLVVYVEPAGFHCYDHGEDDDAVFASTAGVEAWLSTREEAARTPSAVIKEMAQTFDWQVLRDYPFRLDVSWSDGMYCATLPALYEPSFGANVRDVVNGAAEMLCQLFDAPAELARQLTITVEMDNSATDQMRSAA
ncbi:hypothetical protein GCM10009839_58690 [Catenulispora yoronensis]|uniref:Uncharacterized protein n=1 Tax=Catenulispora yoronensis TaxID=450799 RepID=A0ABP5GH88_9ACTN